MSKYNPQYVRLTSDSTLALGACDGANDSWDTLQPLWELDEPLMAQHTIVKTKRQPSLQLGKENNKSDCLLGGNLSPNSCSPTQTDCKHSEAEW